MEEITFKIHKGWYVHVSFHTVRLSLQERPAKGFQWAQLKNVFSLKWCVQKQALSSILSLPFSLCGRIFKSEVFLYIGSSFRLPCEVMWFRRRALFQFNLWIRLVLKAASSQSAEMRRLTCRGERWGSGSWLCQTLLTHRRRLFLK